MCFAVVFDKYIVALVVLLFRVAYPSAVIRRIIAVIIYPVDR